MGNAVGSCSECVTAQNCRTGANGADKYKGDKAYKRAGKSSKRGSIIESKGKHKHFLMGRYRDRE